MNDYEKYVELKRNKAKEQGKIYWFEAKLTDKEANLRVSRGKPEESSCNSCRHLRDTARHLADQCLLGHNPSNLLKEICDEWRYFS